MKRTVLGIAVIVAVVVGFLLSTGPVVAGPPSFLLVCPSAFTKVTTQGNVDKDINGDGFVCRLVVSADPFRIIMVIDNNVVRPAR